VIENVILSAVFGVIGYLMIRFDYPRITLVVALVLAALAERNYHQAMLMADQSWSIFFSRIPSAVLVVCVLASIASPFVKAYWRKPAAARAASG
jgi:putative tricarboxylic transport membrane protein